MELFGSLLAIAVSFGIAPFIKVLLDLATLSIKLVPPNGIDEEEWNDLVKPKGHDKGGRWLGFFERLLFFFSFYLYAYPVVAGWFAIKIASKWQVWSTVVKVPTALVGQKDNISYLTARHRWASWSHIRFLLGTCVNALIGFVLAAMLTAATN